MTGKKARTRNNTERNIAVADVGAEGEKGNCKNEHTYSDIQKYADYNHSWDGGEDEKSLQADGGYLAL